MKGLLKTTAYLLFFAGAFTFASGVMHDNFDIAFTGLFGGLATGALFLFFAKLLQQNEELLKALNGKGAL